MFDIGEEGGTHFITMEFIHGEDLKSMIRMSGRLAVGTTMNIAKQVCEGLTEAHKSGVVHRDLKPSNIMIDKQGNVRIMDFGIARSLEAKGITGAGVMIGTPEYMSPEQVEGKEVDQRSDIYSFGVILYEMMTGQVPFEGDTPFTIGVKHKSEIPKDPKGINDQIPEDLSKVIMRCLEKDKDKRYQSAGEVRSELENIEKGIPTTERIIPERKPFTSREITVTLGIKKLFFPALIVAAIIIAAVVIWQLLPQKETILPPSGKPSLAVMYFKNNTGDDSLGHWRTALADLLITDLTQSKYLRVLSEDKLYNILGELNQLEAKSYSSKTLKEVAAQGRVNYILQGNFTKAGENFRINITLQEAASGELIGSERVEGTGEESFYTMVDDLTNRIKANFKLSAEEIASDLDKEVKNITTSSPEAFKYFTEGRRYHMSGDYRKSIQLMERALEIDPEFAMAYRSMGMSYNNLYLFSERTKNLQKALELADRLSARERYQIEGDFYSYWLKTYDKAAEAFKKLLELYPDDTSANNNLGNIYSDLEQWDEAIQRYEVCRANKTEFIPSYTSLASMYRAIGMYDKAKEVLEDYINNTSDNAAIRRALASLYMEQGEMDLAMAEADRSFYLNPTHYANFMRKGDIYLYQGDLVKAEEEYKNLLNLREPAGQAFGRQRLSRLYLLQGKFQMTKSISQQSLELAKRTGQILWEITMRLGLAGVYISSGDLEDTVAECDKVWNMSVEAEFLEGQRNALYTKAYALIQMKSMDLAQKTAIMLKEKIEAGMNKKLIRLYLHLMGRIELERGNYSQAIEYIAEALSLLSYGPLDHRADFIDSLAFAYYKAGDMEKAIQEYEKITLLTTGRTNYGNIFANSFYMIGKIHEQLGNTAKAKEFYGKFLDLRKDADPGIAEVEDAKTRLAKLQSP
jgi:tetratricopeptide (TPR) repeat protein